MKIICTQENLSKALSYLERATGKQSTLPILSNFLLRVDHGRLKLSSTNLEIGVTATVNAKIEGVGEIAAPVKIISNFVGNLPGDDVVSIDVQGNSVSVASGGYDMRVRGLDSKDFPIIPERKGEHSFQLPAQDLKTALQRILPCASSNESRLELTGISMQFLKGEVHLAATDSFRLAEQVLRLPDGVGSEGYEVFRDQNPSLILPHITMQELSRIISPETVSVFVAFEENQVFFDIDGVSIVSRVINGKYPDYKQILPKEFSYVARLSRDEFLRAVRMAGVFASQVTGEMMIVVSPEKGEVQVSARSSEIGENRTVIKAEVSGGDPVQIVFNPRYVIDGLNAVSSEVVAFLLNSSSTPAGFRSVGSDGIEDPFFLYIAMPIRK
ncbi:MAG: DNA polymerase III subunit beta [Candidatus Moranbacteria bacterium]|nr:DNA polymerase III subunit beta [Candidatus Moranbacteria bacterium]